MQWDAGRWYKDVPESVSGIKRVLLVRRKRKSNLTLHYFIVAKNAERYAKNTNKYIYIVNIDKNEYIL